MTKFNKTPTKRVVFGKKAPISTHSHPVLSKKQCIWGQLRALTAQKRDAMSLNNISRVFEINSQIARLETKI